MPEFELVKTAEGLIGYTQDDHKKYVTFREKSRDMEDGEYMRVKVTYPRSLGFHRRFMKMVRFAFDQWEPEKERKRQTFKGLPIHKDFERFRKDILILAGYGEAKFDAKGRVTMEALSISFDNMTEDTFRPVYGAVYEVLFNRLFQAKGYTREELDRVLAEFEGYQPT